MGPITGFKEFRQFQIQRRDRSVVFEAVEPGLFRPMMGLHQRPRPARINLHNCKTAPGPAFSPGGS